MKHITKGIWKTQAGLLHPISYIMPRGEDIEGVEVYNEWVSLDRSIFPDITFTILETIAESDKAATAFIVKGTNEKEFRGIPATHTKFETVGVIIFHFRNNKIKEGWVVVDGLTAALQIGAIKIAN
jgi:predicted ester cyclase